MNEINGILPYKNALFSFKKPSLLKTQSVSKTYHSAYTLYFSSNINCKMVESILVSAGSSEIAVTVVVGIDNYRLDNYFWVYHDEFQSVLA